MNIYITQNGQQLGPYTLNEVQDMVKGGTATLADFAWYEGLPNWVPLKQVEGVSLAGAHSLAVPHERPVGVWIVSLIYFVWMPLSLLGVVLVPAMAGFNDHDTPVLRHYYETVGLWNYYLPRVLGIGLAFVWAVQFFRLKKNSIYFLLTYLGYGVVRMGWVMMSGPFMKMAPGIILGTAAVIWTIKGALLCYNWYLIKKNVLR